MPDQPNLEAYARAVDESMDEVLNGEEDNARGSAHRTWSVLGAVPETLQTAYGSLSVGLDLQRGQSLLIRGGTSSVGLAAAAIAKELGATVLSTTRQPDRADALKAHGWVPFASMRWNSAYFSARMEDGVAIADPAPAELLLLSNTACLVPPYLLRHTTVLALER